MSLPAPQAEPERFPASSPRWERARLAAAYDEAAEALWAEITEACQRSLSRAGRIEAAVVAALGLLEKDPALAHLLVLMAPLSAEAGLGERHRLLADHLAELLGASLPPAAVRSEAEPRARAAIDQAFAMTGARLREEGARDLARLRTPLTKALMAAKGRGRQLSRG